MPSINKKAADIQGLLPALDRRVVAEPYVIDGKNFVWDTKGPYAGFGSILPSNQKIDSNNPIQTFQIDNEYYHFSHDNIYKYDQENDAYNSVYAKATLDPDVVWPWTHAIVGRMHYLARRGVGLVQYNPFTETWAELTQDAVPFLPDPTTIVGVDEAYGRLILLTTTDVIWSALDNGTDLEPNLNTRVGRQVISAHVRGQPLRVSTVASGFLTYTTEGIMVSKFVQNESFLFFHDRLTSEIKAVGPYAVVKLNDEISVCVDRKGFYTSDGNTPEKFQPVFSEFLTRIILHPTRDLHVSDHQIVYLHYDTGRQYLILGLGSNANPGVYRDGYILYLPLDKWGDFSIPFTGFGNMTLDSGSRIGDNFGFYDPEGRFHLIDENLPYQEVRAGDGTTIYEPLDAYIHVGLFRWEEARYPDELSEIQELAVGMDNLPEGATEEDWNDSNNPAEDWNASDHDPEDWGFNIPGDFMYDLEIIGTNDGITKYTSKILTGELDVGATEFYNLGTGQVAIYHSIRISAEKSVQSFHLKSLEMSGIMAGRLT